MRTAPPKALLLDLGVSDRVSVGEAGELVVEGRVGSRLLFVWRAAANGPATRRLLGVGGAMDLIQNAARIAVDRKKGSRLRIRFVADEQVRIRRLAPVQPA